MKPSATTRAWLLAQRALAGGALVALSPLFGLLWLAVRASSPGPFLFRQQRRGLGGVPFTIYKIRTMTLGSERATALGVEKTNPAITRVGRLLRELKLDELPQLVNVLRGEMTLVGPRPLPIALEDRLLADLPEFGRRWEARPGLTNLAQVSLFDNGVGDELLDDWRRRTQAELNLLRHQSPAYDLILIGLTLAFLLRRVAGRLRPRPSQPAPAGAATEVLGVPIHNGDYASTCARIAGWIERRESRTVAVCPVHSLMDSFRHPLHREALLAADHVTADGVPIVWAQRFFGAERASRVYGPDLTLELLRRAEALGWRVAFYGGHPDRLETLLEVLSARFPELQVVFHQSPPFRRLSEREDAAVVRALRAARPDLVFVGLGAPKQERWLHEHRGRVPGVLIGVGAAFDFHAGAVRQAPSWIQRCGMEWAFRLAMEPRRLFARYARSNPAFVARIGLQVVAKLRGQRFQVSPPEEPARSFSPPGSGLMRRRLVAAVRAAVAAEAVGERAAPSEVAE